MWLSRGSEVSFKQRASWKICNAEIISLPTHKEWPPRCCGFPTHSRVGKRDSPGTLGEKSLQAFSFQNEFRKKERGGHHCRHSTSATEEGRKPKEAIAPLLTMQRKTSSTMQQYKQQRPGRFTHGKVIKWLTEMELDLPLLVFSLTLSVPLLWNLVCMYALHMHGRCMLLHGGQPAYCSYGTTRRLC